MRNDSIRFATPADAGVALSLYDFYVRNTSVTFETETPSESEFQKRIRTISAFYPYLLCFKGDLLLGYAYAHRAQERAAYQWNAELSVYVRSGHSGQGVGTALYQALFPMLEAMGILNVYACIALPNPESVALHEKFGLKSMGVWPKSGYKLEKWHDVLWMERRLSDPEKPKPPRSVWESGYSL